MELQRLFTIFLGTSLLLRLSGCLPPVRARGSAPNIVLLVADDLGVGEVGLWRTQNGKLRTPELDKLGRAGMVFSAAYAGYTVCAPSRTALFTGFHSGSFVKKGLNGERLMGDGRESMELLPRVLKGAGYRTCLVGKAAPLVDPLAAGFDYFVGQVEQAVCHNMYPSKLDFMKLEHDLQLPLNQKFRSRKVCMAHPELFNYSIDVFHDHALRWLDGASRHADPFFLYYSFTIPHAGGWLDDTAETGAPVPTDLGFGKEPWPAVERGKTMPSSTRFFDLLISHRLDHAAVVLYLDNKVGEIVRRLISLGLANDTLILFFSDNGPHVEGGHDVKFFNSSGGLRGHKRSLYEGGVRSPSIAHWPGRIQAGSKSSCPWALWDVLPTLAAVAGVPQDGVQGVDGESILPALLSQSCNTKRLFFFSWRSSFIEAGEYQQRMVSYAYGVRKGKYKGVVKRCHRHPQMDDVFELYDLSQDPGERNDIAAKLSLVVQALKLELVPLNFSCRCYQCGLRTYSRISDAIVQA